MSHGQFVSSTKNNNSCITENRYILTYYGWIYYKMGLKHNVNNDRVSSDYYLLVPLFNLFKYSCSYDSIQLIQVKCAYLYTYLLTYIYNYTSICWLCLKREEQEHITLWRSAQLFGTVCFTTMFYCAYQCVCQWQGASPPHHRTVSPGITLLSCFTRCYTFCSTYIFRLFNFSSGTMYAMNRNKIG